MTSRILLAAVATGCVAAAGVGGYLAVRSSATGAASPAPVESSIADGVTGPAEALTAPAEARVTAAPRLKAAPEPRAAASASPDGTTPRTETPQITQEQQVTTQQIETASADIPADAVGTGAAPDLARVPPVEVTSARPVPAIEEIAIPAEAVVGIRLETPVSSKTSAVEDRVTGVVTRDVKIDGQTVVPSGTRVAGYVSVVQRGGKVRERARVGIRFTSITANDVRIPIETETIFREGDAPGGEATAKIGASAVVGTILGGVFGGKKGAAIGGAAGAAGGTAVVMTGEPNPATIAAGTPLTIRLSAPVTVAIER